MLSKWRSKPKCDCRWPASVRLSAICGRSSAPSRCHPSVRSTSVNGPIISSHLCGHRHIRSKKPRDLWRLRPTACGSRSDGAPAAASADHANASGTGQAGLRPTRGRPVNYRTVRLVRSRVAAIGAHCVTKLVATRLYSDNEIS